MNIGARAIDDRGVYVIAELGVNHDGSVDRALELVDAAAGAGADAVKVQLFDADLLMSAASKLAAYQRSAGERDPLEMLRRLQLTSAQMEPVVARARARGVHAIATVFSVELVGEAERLGFDAYKTASPDIIHRPLLEALAATGRPLIVSTGASTLEEVLRARSWLEGARERLAFLQCVSSYPVPEGREALEGVRALLDVLDTPVGYSDHTTSVETGFKAVAGGASILEKHMTYSTRAAGPDHGASLEPGAMAQYVRLAREALPWRARVQSVARRIMAANPGVSDRREKVVLPCEQDVRSVSRQSIVTRRALAAGHVLTRDDLTFKRPGTGLPPFMVGEVVGRALRQDVEGDVPLMAEAV